MKQIINRSQIALSLLVIATLAASTGCATYSLGVDVHSTTVNRFVYENIAIASGNAAMVLTLILSAVQKDIYWVTRRKSLKLDERQIKERQQVFELSYKLGIGLAVVTALLLTGYSYDILKVLMLDGYVPGSDLARQYGVTLPGSFYWPISNLIVGLFALPLLVATWKKR